MLPTEGLFTFDTWQRNIQNAFVSSMFIIKMWFHNQRSAWREHVRCIALYWIKIYVVGVVGTLSVMWYVGSYFEWKPTVIHIASLYFYCIIHCYRWFSSNIVCSCFDSTHQLCGSTPAAGWQPTLKHLMPTLVETNRKKKKLVFFIFRMYVKHENVYFVKDGCLYCCCSCQLCVCLCLASLIYLSLCRALCQMSSNKHHKTSQYRFQHCFAHLPLLLSTRFYFLDRRHFYINRYRSRSQSQFMGIRIQMIRVIAAAAVAALAEPDELFLFAFAFWHFIQFVFFSFPPRTGDTANVNTVGEITENP